MALGIGFLTHGAGLDTSGEGWDNGPTYSGSACPLTVYLEISGNYTFLKMKFIAVESSLNAILSLSTGP